MRCPGYGLMGISLGQRSLSKEAWDKRLHRRELRSRHSGGGGGWLLVFCGCDSGSDIALIVTDIHWSTRRFLTL
jgi:hypothetical protein